MPLYILDSYLPIIFFYDVSKNVKLCFVVSVQVCRLEVYIVPISYYKKLLTFVWHMYLSGYLFNGYLDNRCVLVARNKGKGYSVLVAPGVINLSSCSFLPIYVIALACLSLSCNLRDISELYWNTWMPYYRCFSFIVWNLVLWYLIRYDVALRLSIVFTLVLPLQFQLIYMVYADDLDRLGHV